MQDLHGNDVPIVNFRVTFMHDHGVDTLIMGGHVYPSDQADLDGCLDGIRRAGFRNPAVTGWTPVTTTPEATNGEDQADDTTDEDSFNLFRDLLAPNLGDPGTYYGQLVLLLSMHLGHIRHQHRRCIDPGCRTCRTLAEVDALAQAHNSLQTFNEITEDYEPYDVLRFITSSTRPTGTTPATEVNAR